MTISLGQAIHDYMIDFKKARRINNDPELSGMVVKGIRAPPTATVIINIIIHKDILRYHGRIINTSNSTTHCALLVLDCKSELPACLGTD